MSTKTQEMIAEELETLLLDALDIEEEEEEDEEEEFDDDDDFDPDEDRGDDVDPDLPDDDDDLEGEGDDDGDADGDSDADDLDADDLADLAGEGEEGLVRSAAGAPVVVAGDTLNDLGLFQAGYSGIMVGNAEQPLRDWLPQLPKTYLAEGEGCSGILEGLRHFGFGALLDGERP